jgi:hydrogenase/urease accessory protein HupE
MALFVIGWLAITLLLALAGYAIGAKLCDRL